MGRGWILVVLVLASSCGPDRPTVCRRQQVGRSGELNPTVDTINVPELLIANERAEVRVFAPLTACVSETPAFTVELYDAANLPVTFEPPTLTSFAGQLQLDVAFTPTTPGTYLLRTTFEPNLGGRSTTLTVVGPADVDAGVLVTLPMPLSQCRDGVWPLSTHAVVCESVISDDIDVVFSDGGVERFAGISVVTAGPILWSVDAVNQRLERRALDDAGLRVTHQWNGFGRDIVAGMHSETFALRRGNAELRLVEVTDTEWTNTVVSSFAAQPPPTIYVYAGEWVGRVGVSGCDQGTPDCLIASPPLGVEPGFVWSWDPFMPRFLRAWPLTGRDALSTPPTLLPGHPVSQSLARGPFERLPLWIERSVERATDDAVLVSFEDRALTLSSWPRARVLRVGSQVVVLQEPDASTVRLVPKH